MESDFGADLNCDDDDDWVQSYADYGNQQEDDSYYGEYENEYEGAYGGAIVENNLDECKDTIEDLLASEKIQNPNEKKSKSRKRKQAKSASSLVYDHSPRKRKRRKHVSGVETFLNEVLSWPLRDLFKDCRATLRLPRLVLPSLTYNNFSELTAIVQQVAIEETRVAILRGCSDPADVIFFDLCEEPPTKKMTDALIPINFFVRRGAADLLKPGWVFCLFPQNASNARHREGNYSSKSSVRSELLHLIHETGGGVLTTLALGRHSFNQSSSITMWVHSQSFFQCLQQQEYPHCDQQPSSLEVPTQWVGYAVENIITHQRIASLSHDPPRFPFVERFLGQKEPSHIVFNSDSDSEGSDAGDEGRGVVFVSGDRRVDREDSGGSNNNSIVNDIESSDPESDREPEDEDDLPPTVDISCLDPSQRQALTNSLSQIDRGNSLGLVQGPPGCGKTFFLIHLLLTLVHERNKRVLVSAPSNKAISVVVAQYSKRRFTKWKDDMIVSIGVEDKFGKCSDDGRDDVPLEAQFDLCERQLLELWTSFACADRTHGSNNSGDFPFSDRQSSQSAARLQQTALPATLLPESVSAALTAVTNPDTVLDVLVYKYASRVATAINYLGISFATSVKFHERSTTSRSSCGWCVRSGLKAVLNTLAGEYADLIDTLQSIVPDFFRATVEVVDSHKIFKTSAEKVHANVFECLKLLAGAFDLVWVSPESEAWAEHSSSIEAAADALSRQLKLLHTIFASAENSDYVADELLSRARVVCCTLSTAGCGLMKRKADTFDVLLVDEAGQCLEGELLIPCFLNPSSLVLIGDPQQLPATVLSKEVQEKCLGTSSMQRLMTSSFAQPRHSHSQQQRSGFQLLSTQYRMHPAICSFPNEQFYKGQLNTSSSVLERCGILANHWLARYPAVFVNIAAPENNGTLRSKSRYNIAEAEMTAKILQSLQQHVAKYPVRTSVDVGIITFYSAQVKIINQQLRKHDQSYMRGGCGRGINVKVMSVDGFQGSEADVIILSFVRSNRKKTVGFLKDFQRLNVALTRAKHHLVMIGDADTLVLSDCSDLNNLIVEMKRRNVLLDQEECMAKLCLASPP